MSRYLHLLCALTVGLAAACDPRGVSLGTEELCVADQQIAVAQARSPGEQISTCARLGDNQLLNASFEAPVVGSCEGGFYCQFPVAAVQGWSTNSTDQVIEIWHDGYRDVPAPDGSQFVELDATSQDTLWQDVMLPAGQLMYWSLLHHGRDGIESIELRIGPPEATVSQAVLSSAADAWYPYSGLYRVGVAEPVTRFALVSRSGIAEGNLVDAIVFAPVE